MKVAFLGTGNMASALISGAIRARFIKPQNILGTDKDLVKLRTLSRKLKFKSTTSNVDCIKDADYIFVCVKPQQIHEVLLEIAPHIRAKQCVVSIAAGTPLRKIEGLLSGKVPVIRVMPNTPALVGLGVSVLTRGRWAKRSHIHWATQFFSSVGVALELHEKHFDAVTALSGSGPAYVFYLAEILEVAGKKLGLPTSVVSSLTRGTILGSAKMLQADESASVLRQRVTSPRGTTEAALNHLRANAWDEILVAAVKKARDRSHELSS